MDWQFPIVIVAVGAAGLYLARSAWRTWSSAKDSCGGSCACGHRALAETAKSGHSRFIPVDKVTLLRRETQENC
jgi:hypothetical protein